MFDAIKLPIAGLGGAAAGGLAVFLWAVVIVEPAARQEGRLAAAGEARQAVFEQIKERNLTNAAVARMSDADKCKLIGGVLQNGECS